MNKYNLAEPTSPTAVVVGTINGEKRTAVRACESDLASWALYHCNEIGRERYWHRWDDLLDLFDSEPRIVDVDDGAKPCTDQPTGLTEEQREVIRTFVSYGSRHRDLVGMTGAFRAAFPDVFTDPTGGDPVVEARGSEDGERLLFYRCEDGKWSLTRGRERGMWDTGELLDVRRFLPATIADLMYDPTKEEA